MKDCLRGEIVTRPKISIIVPVYNVEQYLPRCIHSLRNQTLHDIEVILVDDGSSDGSSQICDQMATEDCRIKVIHKLNEGAGKARNAALEIATGEYIGFVDSDDFVEKEMFETLYNKANEYEADLVMSGVSYVDGNMFSEKGTCVIMKYFDKDTRFDTAEDLKKLRMGIAGALPEDVDDSKYGMSIWKNLFRHEIIKQNHLVFQSERVVFSEDALFMIDYISHIKRAIGIPEAYYNYCRNGESISKSYKKDRFEKILVFIAEVQKRLSKDIEANEYKIYIERFWQAMCRVVCSQEIMHANDNKIKYADLRKRLNEVCSHSFTVQTLNSYPIYRLPFKQRLFAYGMKYRLYLFLKLLVKLRNR